MTVHTVPGNRGKLEAAFEAFHHDHPEVYTELVGLARDLRRRGYTRFGIGMLFEILRWRRMRAVRSSAYTFKLNNNLRAYYARLIMVQEPDLRDAFNTRELSVPHHIVP